MPNTSQHATQDTPAADGAAAAAPVARGRIMPVRFTDADAATVEAAVALLPEAERRRGVSGFARAAAVARARRLLAQHRKQPEKAGI